MTPNPGPSPERWSAFTLPQQIIMIANDLNRASKWMGPGDADLRQSAYARALALTDLTVATHPRVGLRRELLRWRDLLAQLYIEGEPSPERNAELMKVLLRFTYESSRQIRHTPGLST
jgi:hypothetical protein